MKPNPAIEDKKHEALELLKLRNNPDYKVEERQEAQSTVTKSASVNEDEKEKEKEQKQKEVEEKKQKEKELEKMNERIAKENGGETKVENN